MPPQFKGPGTVLTAPDMDNTHVEVLTMANDTRGLLCWLCGRRFAGRVNELRRHQAKVHGWEPEPRVCRIGLCGNPELSNGYCSKHLTRLHRYGDPYHEPDSVEVRLWKYLPEMPQPDDVCWEWTGARNSKGYGALKVGGKMQVATRCIFGVMNPGVDISDLYVLHRCDNPPCVNPSHLFIGTAADNTRDMMEKGREKLFGGDVDAARARAREARNRNYATLERFCLDCGVLLDLESARVYGHTVLDIPKFAARCLSCERTHGRERAQERRRQ